ncbi:MAG: hypothetical protein U0T74_15110 [Chitinophagales bacterium]
MQIVVIDNFEWNDIDHGVNISENVPYLYIPTLSNYVKGVKTPRTFEDVIGDIETLGDSSEIIYLINVHCVFSNGNSKRKTNWYLQEQNGINIYRQLLKVYEKKESELKTAFFSPIPKVDLIKLRAENYVLKYHECFTTPFNWKNRSNELLAKTDWKTFNNASENLLSGFNMFKLEGTVSKKIETGKKRILFIDDQRNEWETTFSEVFNESALVHLPYANQTEFRTALADNKVLKAVNSNIAFNENKNIANCNIVLSDFYLKEDHEPGKWMNKESIEGISGFNLFHSVRATDKGKGIPYIMHTSSNKIPYYKIFDQQGVDDWIVKDTRPDATATEKSDNYILFKKTIETISKQNVYKKLQDLWEDIQQIKNTTTSKWWYSPQYDAALVKRFKGNMIFVPVNDVKSDYSYYTKGDIVSILESSWFAIRRQINKEADYEGEGNNATKGNEADRFLATSICNNLGKIVEILSVKSGAKDFSYLTNFLLQIRNSASHASDYEYFELNDVFICLDFLIHALLNFDSLDKFRDAYPDKKIISRISYSEDDKYIFPCALIWLYIQFYNEEFSKQSEHGRTAMKTRISKLHSLIKGKGVIEEVVTKSKVRSDLNSWFNSTFKREANTSTTDIKPKDPIKISIPIQL